MLPSLTTALPALDRLPSDPLEVARRWPRDRGMLMLVSGRHHPRWGRWTTLAEAPASERWLRVPDHGDDGPDPLDQLRRAGIGARATGPTVDAGMWIGAFGYELGRTIEPAARHAAGPRRSVGGTSWPLIELARPEVALVHDGLDGSWHGRGAPDALRRIVDPIVAAHPGEGARPRSHLTVADDLVEPQAWRDAVGKTVELIRAGDLFQANVTRPLRVRVDGDARSAALALLAGAQPWHGALLEMPDGRAVVSLSPELFLDATLPRPGRPGRVVTRPIKGTRPSAVDADVLLNSDKDMAELVMIVDLMRNDLGRVSEIGSVRVTEARSIESHPTVHHGVATVEGRLRDDVDLAALLRATFPPGSVTGAPKVRAMQVIESLEPFARGPYCGAIGLIDDDGTVRLNVAIRTLALDAPTGRASDGPASRAATAMCHEGVYGVGCGIVADSDPDLEYAESLDKAAVLRNPD